MRLSTWSAPRAQAVAMMKEQSWDHLRSGAASFDPEAEQVFTNSQTLLSNQEFGQWECRRERKCSRAENTGNGPGDRFNRRHRSIVLALADEAGCLMLTCGRSPNSLRGAERVAWTLRSFANPRA